MRTKMHAARTALALMAFFAAGQSPGSAPAQRTLRAKSSRIKSITVLLDSGVRPRFSPDGGLIVHDRRNADQFYAVYLSDIKGNIVRSLTKDNPGIAQRNNGNARFDPSGKYIVFVSEEPHHFMEAYPRVGDSGIGLYSNFWATDLEGRRFWKLTNLPVKRSLADGIPSFAVVNPIFSRDGHTFLWTERYADGGHSWGRWRIKAADFVVSDGQPSLRNERILITPSKGNYVTAMASLSDDQLLVAGNLEGQHEYGMDQYVYDLRTGHYVNLTNTPEVWDEGSCVAPNGEIVWMSNLDSKYKYDFSRRDWPNQQMEREYYSMTSAGQNKQRLTFFNDPAAPEYLGTRAIVAACDISRDGRFLAGTLGIDHGTETKREREELKVILIEFNQPLAMTSR